MTMHTKDIYINYVNHNIEPDKAFQGNYPEWKIIDKIGDSWVVRVLFGVLYVLFYVKFATSPWMYALLPIHFFMGPIHGAIVTGAATNTGIEIMIITTTVEILYRWISCF